MLRKEGKYRVTTSQHERGRWLGARRERGDGELRGRGNRQRESDETHHGALTWRVLRSAGSAWKAPAEAGAALS